MNLLMISGDRTLASGKQGAFYNTLEELHKHFDRIDVICPHVAVTRYDMSLFGNVFIHPSPWPLFLQWLWIVRCGLQFIRTHRPPIMTVHEYPFVFNGIGARALRRMTGIPYVLEVHHVVGYPQAAGFREVLGRWLTRRVVPWTAARAIAVRVVNRIQVPGFLRSIGISEKKIVVVPSAYINLDVFTPLEIPKHYDIIFVGRMSSNKGLNIFLEVMEKTKLVGIAVGDGPLLDWARSQSKRRNLKIHFPGFAKDSEEVARYLNESRLLLMPSLNEGGPRVVLEAMACGVPVIATPVGIVPDVLPPEAIEEWNADDISDKVQNILRDEQLYSRLRDNGIATAQGFERTAAIKNYADKLKELAK